MMIPPDYTKCPVSGYRYRFRLFMPYEFNHLRVMPALLYELRDADQSCKAMICANDETSLTGKIKTFEGCVRQAINPIESRSDLDPGIAWERRVDDFGRPWFEVRIREVFSDHDIPILTEVAWTKGKMKEKLRAVRLAMSKINYEYLKKVIETRNLYARLESKSNETRGNK